MPNGGITPDCAHCKYCSGVTINKMEPYCEQHQMSLPIPIRVFCSRHQDRDDEDEYQLEHNLDRHQLQNSQMYVWLGGYEVEFYHMPLISIAEFGQWTYKRFLDELAKLSFGE